MSRKHTQHIAEKPIKPQVVLPDAAAIVLCCLLLMVPFIGGFVTMEPGGAGSVSELFLNLFGPNKDINLAAGVSLGLIGAACLVLKPQHLPRWMQVLLGLFCVWTLICGVMSPYRADALRQAFLYISAALCIVVAASLNGKSKQWIMVLLAAAGSIVAFVAVREYMANVRTAPQWRVFGPFQTPNILAAYLCLTIPLTLSLISRKMNQDTRMLAIIGWLLQVAAVVLTGSRFGVVAASLGVFVWLVYMTISKLWNREVTLRVLQALVLAIVIAVLCTAPLRNRVGSAPAADAKEHSGQFRVMTWKGTMNLIKAHPLFGTGAGCYVYGYPKTAITGFTRSAHQGYMQVASELGIPGLLLWLGICGGCMVVAMRRQNTSVSPELRGAVAAGVVASAIHGIIDSDWQVFSVIITFAVLMGLCWSDDAESKPRSSAKYRIVGILALVCALWVSLQAVYAQLAQYQLMSGDFTNAEKSNNVVLSLCPFDGDALLGNAMITATSDRASASEIQHQLDAACQAMPSPRSFMMAARSVETSQNLSVQALADRYYKQLIEVDPTAPRGYVRYGAYLEKRDTNRAKMIYAKLAALDKSPSGLIRAVPEIPETDYAFGYGGLARIAVIQSDIKAAHTNYLAALSIINADHEARAKDANMSAAKPRELSSQLDALESEAKAWLTHDE